jgi:DNA-directed RNA polymerase subunit beta'
VRIKEYESDGENGWQEKITRYNTTAGRALLSEILPKGLPFSVIDKPLKKKEISKLINAAFRRCGLKETVVFADKLMQNGYRLATRAGISICSDDMLVPSQKREIIRRRKGSQGNREPVHQRSGDQRRALQQGGRYLGPYR